MKLFKKVLSLVLICSSGALYASGFNTPQASASYVGQGQTGINSLENASMVVHNPAALVFLPKGTQVYGGMARYDTNYNYQDLNGGNKASTIHDPSIGPHGYASHNTGDWAFGVGVSAPFNSGVEWPSDWNGKYELTKIRLNVVSQPTVFSHKINDNFSVGGGLNLIYAKATLEQVTDAGPAIGGSTGDADIPTSIEGTDTTFAANFAALYRMGQWSMAATHNLGYEIEAEGTVEFDTSVNSLLDSSFPDGDATTKLNIPAITEIAVSYSSMANMGDGYRLGAWSVELGATHTTWSDYDEIVIEFEEGLPQESSTSETDWFDVTDYKVGGFYSFRDDMKVRFGYYMTASPIPEETLGPSTPDGEGRDSFFTGYGYKRGSLLFDAAYIYTIFKDSKTETNEDLTGEYKDGKAQTLVFSVGYRFD